MYQKVLIASDPEGLAEQSVAAVAGFVGGTDATVRVVAVEEAVAPATIRLQVAERLHRIVADLRDRGLAAEGIIEPTHRGHIADHLASAASRWGADLIVLGSHRRGDLRSLFVGSIGHALARRTRTPLLFIGTSSAEATPGRPPTDLRNVLVAIDNDKGSQLAVESAIEISGRATRVHVLHVQVLPRANSVDSQVPVDIIEREREHGHYLIEGALQRLADHGIHATWEITEPSGSAAKAIARAADDFDADVIVLGSRRLPTPLALVVGSVAHDVIALTDRPVLLAGLRTETQATKATEIEDPAAEPASRNESRRAGPAGPGAAPS